jgi:flavin-dependent dehydrogenase
MDPFTGQGIGNAFLGGELLGRALVDGLGGADQPLSQALGAYQSRRDELTGPMHELTHSLAAFDWDDNRGLELFLEFRATVEELRVNVASLCATAPAAAASR